MAKNLVIVESPAKAKTIKKYLGNDYQVLASYGHVRDLIPKDGAVDTENDFAMSYRVIERNERHVKAIIQALKDADTLVLATDPDREGEAIAWHLVELLREKKVLKEKLVQRVVFYEITQREVQKAISEPREVSADLVNAQQARRALDYLVGFNLSPLLWRKVQPGLSAGRVQSPALRLICEREEEIRAFIPREYWSLMARAEKASSNFSARLLTLYGDKAEQFSLTEAGAAQKAREAILAAADGRLLVAKVDKKQRRRNPAPPFTTSTLQQEANRKLGFAASRTMRAAQQLYEGTDIGGDTVGLITYMRTDSVSLANDAVAEIRELIGKRYGREALPDAPRMYKSKSKNAQEAHEAIRPTSSARTPEQMARHLPPDQARLYELIWKRAVASQMESAIFDTVSAELRAGPEHAFRANGSVLVSPGFIAVYQSGKDQPDDEDDEKRLPELVEGEHVTLVDIDADQHFTEPPPRYTEASLVKTLEEYDIGRPSTYASIISTLQARDYVRMEGKAFSPTDVGMIVNRFLTEHFTRYVDYDFTARLEDDLDAVSRGEKPWIPLLESFWSEFKPRVDEKQELSRKEVNEARVLGTDPVSGKPVTTRLGRYGPFVQIGTKEDEDKPRFASLRANQRIDTITLEEALELFTLPRKLGTTADGTEVEVNIGRFGPYARVGKIFVSLKKDDDPYKVGLERALELYEAKMAALEAATLLRFEEEGIRVVKGRFGPYITDGTLRARVPKDLVAESLTLEDCKAQLEAEAAKKPAKKSARKKATAKKATAKKAASKKSATKKAAAKKTARKTAAKKAAAKKAATKTVGTV
jgi:DNA topoisomerase-1